MRTMLRTLFCYILYILIGTIVATGLFMAYQYSIVYPWEVKSGFFFSKFIDSLYIFIPLISVVAFLRTLFLIRQTRSLYGLHLLLLGFLNLAVLFGVYAWIDTPETSPMERMESNVLPTGYLLNITDDNSLFIGSEPRGGFIVFGQVNQSPYFSVHTDIEFKTDNGIIETPTGISIPITRDMNPYSQIGNSFDVFNIQFYSNYLLYFLDKIRGGVWQWLFFLASISVFLSSLWCTVRSNPAYGMHIWLTIAVTWGVFFAYSVFVAFYAAKNTVSEGIGSVLAFMYNTNAALLIPGVLLYVIYLIRVRNRGSLYE